MAYIEKRGEASWRLVVDVGFDAQGKRIRRTKTVRVDDPALLRTTRRLQKHLEMELRKFEFEVAENQRPDDGRMLFSEFIDLWLTRHVERELEEKSKLNYRFHVSRRIMPFFKDMRMEAITKQHVLEFIDYLHSPEAALRGKKLGAATILYNYRVLRSIFNYAVEWNVIAASPMDGVSKPKEGDGPEMHVYDEKGLIDLFNALDQEPIKTRAFVMLAVTCGLRRGEIAGLEWHHIDLKDRTLRVVQSITMYKDGEPVIKRPKTRRSVRKIALPMIVVDMLEEYRAHWLEERRYAKEKWKGGGKFLFCHENGKPHDPHWFTDKWIEFREKHKLHPIRFHDLRHTAASWMIKQNVHPKAIAARLGHSNIRTTMDVYGHIMESVDQAAASVFDNMPTGSMGRGALVGGKLVANDANYATKDQPGQN